MGARLYLLELNALETDYIIKTLSLDKEPKISMGAFRIIPDYSVDDFLTDFSLLILSDELAWMEQKNNAVLPIVECAVKNSISVGAICNAVNFMAESGFLDKIEHSENTLEFMQSQAPHYLGGQYFLEKQAICDSNIITANDSGTLEFAKEILLLLKAKPEISIAQWYKQNKSGFYRA